MSPITQGIKNPLPIRFSGTWSQDCDTVLSQSPPLDQPVQHSASVGLSVCPIICVNGLPLPAALAPASPGVWALGWRVSMISVRSTDAAWLGAQQWAACCEGPMVPEPWWWPYKSQITGVDCRQVQIPIPKHHASAHVSPRESPKHRCFYLGRSPS